MTFMELGYIDFKRVTGNKGKRVGNINKLRKSTNNNSTKIISYNNIWKIL